METFGRAGVLARLARGHGCDASASSGARETPKYEVIAPIGEGGMGVVSLVQDTDLRREVAMKRLRSELAGSAAMRERFVVEAQATSQLEHPGIPPVHDIGVTDAGDVWFTMKVVRGRTLSSVLKDLVLGARAVRQEWTLHKLCSVLEQVAQAVHFAHEKGVVHRDLKPDNVMLGEFGEVHVMDWGIAKLHSESATPHAGDTVETSNTDALLTQAGTVKGTIPYMSPEQARGEAIDRRSDVYALGAILYEILALQPAFEGQGPALILRVRAGDVPPVETRNPRRPVPEPLAGLCRRAMAKDAKDRTPTALAFLLELRAWLDGRAETERRHREAETLAAQGRLATARYVAAKEAIEAALRQVDAVAAQFKPWQSFEEKAPLHAARDAVRVARDAAVLAFAETTRLLEGALLAEPANATARGLLADLWRDRLDDAERRGDGAETSHALTMVRRYDDGRLAEHLAGEGRLDLESDPPGARVALIAFESRHGLCVAGPERDLGVTPLASIALPMGSYLCVLRHPGFPDVRYPVHVTRGRRRWTGRVKLRTREEIGEGFVYVPGGPFVYGEGRDLRVVELPDFAIAEKPVTLGDWIEFLVAVESERGLEAAGEFIPGAPGDGAYLVRGEDGAWRPSPVVVEGPARDRCLREHGPDFDRLLPVAGVSWFHAAAWCEWRSRVTGRSWRLPTEEEREKAARGVDGRIFPWGDAVDESLGKCRDSREERSQPEPVGCFPAATSVYGMIDAAGNSLDWTDSWFDARRASRVLRGGSWSSNPAFLRCAHRFWNPPAQRMTVNGLRAARSF